MVSYCNTTGFDTVDYLITDKNLINENEHNLFRRNINMPNVWNYIVVLIMRENLMSYVH